MPTSVAEECGFTSAPTVPVGGYYNLECTAELIDSDTIKLLADFTIAVIGYGLDLDGSSDKANLTNSNSYPLPTFKIFK